jgi:hypothetical protein
LIASCGQDDFAPLPIEILPLPSQSICQLRGTIFAHAVLDVVPLHFVVPDPDYLSDLAVGYAAGSLK